MTRLGGALLCLTIGAGLAVTASASDGLSAAESRGKKIYTTGETESGRVIRAEVQLSTAPASASILPCVQCHGEGGEGIGDVAPAIRWDTLSDPGGHEHLQRKHGPFDVSSVARAIRDGIDAAGNGFEATMPRYRMTDADMSDLVAYLKRIGTELDPGLAADTIRVGTLLPTSGPLAATGTVMRQVIEAYFSQINSAGGVHGRTLQLVVGGYGGDDTPAFWAARDLVSMESPFALVGSYMPGYESELSSFVNESQLPHVGPHALLSNNKGGGYEFYTQASIVEQTHALVRSSSAGERWPNLAIVYPTVKDFDTLVEPVRNRALDAGAEVVRGVPYALGALDAAGMVRNLADSGIEAVVFLGAGKELLEFARAAHDRSWAPELFAPAQFAERVVFDLPGSFDGQVSLAYAALDDDYTIEGVTAFEIMHRDFAIGYSNSLAQVAAFTAARVLVAGLERAGRDLSRQALVESLEEIEDFAPGLSPTVSYSADRRIGSLGAHVLRVDLAEGRLDAERRWVSIANKND